MNRTIRFHVLPEDSHALTDAVKAVSVHPEDIVAALEHYCKELIEERAKFLSVDAKIAAQLDRRVEIAVKSVLDRMQPRMATMAEEMVRDRIHKTVADAAINVAVSVTT